MNPREIARNSSKKSLRRPSREPLSRRRRVDGALLPSAHVINTRDKRTPAPSRGMNTQSPAIVRGSDQRTRMIVSSSSAAALSAASLFLAVVSPSGARAFAVQLYLLSYEVGRVSGSGTVGSRSVGSDAVRLTPDERRDIDAGGVGMSVADLSISKRINAQRMASTAATCCSVQPPGNGL